MSENFDAVYLVDEVTGTPAYRAALRFLIGSLPIAVTLKRDQAGTLKIVVMFAEPMDHQDTSCRLAAWRDRCMSPIRNIVNSHVTLHDSNDFYLSITSVNSW